MLILSFTKRVSVLFYVFLLLAIPLSLTGCIFGGDDNASTTESDLDVEQILEESAIRWDETDTVAFDLQIEGETYLDESETIELRSAEGQIKRPDQAIATANVSFGFVNFEVSLVFIGEAAYMTDVLSGSWGEAPGDFSYNPGVIMDDESGVTSVLTQLDNASLVGEEVVGGKPVFHITGTVADSQINNMTSGGLKGDEIDVDIWIDEGNFDVLKVVLTAPPSGDDEATIWTLTLSDQNQPVTIERPIS